MRIDAHHHLWDLTVRDQSWIDGETMAPIRRNFGTQDLSAVAERNGISGTILVQTVTVPEETPEFLEIAESNELVAAVTGWVDLTEPSVADDIAVLRQRTGGRWLRGIRHQVQGEPDPRWLCRDDVRRGLRAVADAGLVYELLTLPHQLPAAIETVEALPDAVFVLDHCSKPPISTGELEPWVSYISELAAYDNVYCKLSGLVTEADWSGWTIEQLRPYADVVLDAFGPRRLMFGSDWPVCLLAAPYERVLEAAETLTRKLSVAERHDVFAGTAMRVYQLSI